MTLYCIVNLKTGEKLPAGGSKAEFSYTKAPRLFARKVDAINALECWRMGHWINDIDSYGDGDGLIPSNAKYNVKIAAERQAMDIRIAEVAMTIIVSP